MSFKFWDKIDIKYGGDIENLHAGNSPSIQNFNGLGFLGLACAWFCFLPYL